MSSITIHHIFTHDMRWQDNLALRSAIRAATQSTHMRWQDSLVVRAATKTTQTTAEPSVRVNGWICLDPKQLQIPESQDTKDYRGVPGALSFLFACESLLGDTKHALGPITIHPGSVASLSEQLKKRPDAYHSWVSCAKQYTPFAQIRQQRLERDWGDRFVCVDDHSLLSPTMLWDLKEKKKEYVVFSPFYRLATTLRRHWKPKKTDPKRAVSIPSSISHTKELKLMTDELNKLRPRWKPRAILRTNRTLGLTMIRKLKRDWNSSTYANIRNDINQRTTLLARFLNTGVLSIREVWSELGSSMEALERQLVFRSFYACRINATCQRKWKPGKSLTVSEYRAPKWKSIRSKRWKAWITGTTGVPIVDAAMRCLQETGWMHNRLRMIVASYLTRILRVSWRYGEAWFAQHLFDYDATQNHFGWKGQAALSKDSNEYFRVMNPWRQMKQYDPDATFVHRWIPELRPLGANTILQWETQHESHTEIPYPPPLIPDHTHAAKQSKSAWKQSR